ncbi:MAG TPA: DUF2244 domain-containing protein [Oleiagrimonas sp.]|nr:DUF2244 domain-containing protein [Oleiagrimonas sp.]
MTVWLRPNRTLSHRALKRLAWGLAVAVLATGLIGAHQGNVFAPVFALIEAAAVAWALGIAWRAGGHGERITVDRRSLEVEVLPGHRCTRFQSAWVRVLLAPGGHRRRLLLASHGRELEIGAFLADEERAELWRRLRQLLAQATAPQVQSADNGSDDSIQGNKT